MKKDAPGQLHLFQRYEMVSLGDGSYRAIPSGPPEEWLWIPQAAKLTGLSRETIRIWVVEGKVKGRRMGMRKFQVERASLQQFLEPYNHLK